MLSIDEGRSGYVPWPSVAPAHFSPASFVLCSGAERAGKSISTANEGMAWLPFSELIWIGGPQYRDTLTEFELMAEACLNAGLTTKNLISTSLQKPSVMTMLESDVRVETRSLYDIITALVADAPDLILLVEAGLLPQDPLEKLRLRLSTRRGRCWISGTLEEGAEWFRQAYDRWQQWPNEELGQSVSVPLYENIQDFPGGEEDPEIQTLKKTLRPPVYSERVEGRPAASDLLVFSSTFVRGSTPFCARPSPFVPIDENHRPIPVEIAIDPGHKPSHYTVHFIQEIDNEVRVVDEVVAQEVYHEEMARRSMLRPAWSNVVGGVMDPWAANQHGMGWSRTAREIWMDETGIDLRMPETAPTPPEIIDRYLFYLRHPHNGECRFFFDPRGCPHLLHEWRRWKYQRGPDGRALRSEPLKRHCDGIKGVGYWLVDRFQQTMWDRQFTGSQVRVSRWRFR